MDCEKRLKKLIAITLAAASIFGTGLFAAPAASAAEVETGKGVFIVPGSDINLVSQSSNIPVQIKNTFGSDVTVHVHVQPTNPRVIVPAAVSVMVPGMTSVTAKVPVDAVANGQVELRVWLTTFSGQRLGKSSLLKMNVNADVEASLLIAFGSSIVVLFGLGVARTILKARRKAQVAEEVKA